MAVGRGAKKARNKFFKIESPLIASGDMAGRRDSPRITARIQVIPDAAFNEFGERKITGFTIAELQSVADGGDAVIIQDNDERVLAALELGPGISQWTKAELYEIIDTVTKEGGPILAVSRMDRFDLERERMKNPQPVVIQQAPAQETPAPKRRGRPPKNASVKTDSATGPSEIGESGSEDATA